MDNDSNLNCGFLWLFSIDMKGQDFLCYYFMHIIFVSTVDFRWRSAHILWLINAENQEIPKGSHTFSYNCVLDLPLKKTKTNKKCQVPTTSTLQMGKIFWWTDFVMNIWLTNSSRLLLLFLWVAHGVQINFILIIFRSGS